MMFVFNNVPSFDAVFCKLLYSFWCSYCKSDNMPIQAVLSCDIFVSHFFFKGGIVLWLIFHSSRLAIVHMFLSALCCIACDGVADLESAIENKKIPTTK